MNQQEAVDMIRKSVLGWNRYRRVTETKAVPYLNRVDLSGVCLDGANFKGLRMSWVDFRRSDLDNTNFADAELCCANFSGARASYADFNGAYMNDADLTGVNLACASLRGASMYAVTGLYRLDMIDPRAYIPVAIAHPDGWHIYSGCRGYTLEEALIHWHEDNYDSDEGYSGCTSEEIGARYIRAIKALPECPEVLTPAASELHSQ